MIRDDPGPAALGPFWPGVAPEMRSAPQKRRRVAVFALSFLLLASISLIYSYSRPAEYRAAARVRIDIPVQGETADERRDVGHAAFLTEVEILTSRPLVADALARVAAASPGVPAESADAVDEYRRMLAATPVEGTDVVQLTATGRPAESLAPLLNSLVDVYRERFAERYRRESDGEAARAQEEAERLAARVAERRAVLDDFRLRYDIVSLEREENRVLSRVKGVGQSMNAANDRLVAAEARLRSLAESAAAGRSAVRARDNPTLSNLEQRASQLREELHEMERVYTPDFLAFDPRAKALRMRLANLDEQTKLVRENGQRAALAEAEEEVAAARAAVERLSTQASGDRAAVQAFTARLAEFKAMQEELTGLEATQRAAVVRATSLRAAERIRVPEVTALEAAFAPDEPWRPQYTRDAGIALTASLLIALLVTWIVELFNRTSPGPSLVVAPAWLGGLPAPSTRAPEALAHVAPPGLLAAGPQLPRELDEHEVARLLDELPEDVGIVAQGLLSGLSLGELAKLDWTAVDFAAGGIRLPERMLPLAPVLADALQRRRERQGAGDAALVPVAADPDAVDAALLYAAHDAGLAGADGVNAAALRHSYIAYLVREGVRFGDLPRVVGHLPADALGAYAALAPDGRKRTLDAVDPVHRALRGTRSA